MSRIIINYDDNVDIKDAMLTVLEVTEMGRISDCGNSFCLATKFLNGIRVLADRTKNGTDTFKVFYD